MKTKRLNHAVCGLLVLLIMPAVVIPQGLTSLQATAKGEGTLTTLGEQHKISSVIVILMENGEAEITLITELQLLVQGRWSAKSDLSQGIDLKITGGIVEGNATGTGKLFLTKDGKSIAKLAIQGKGAGGGKVKVQFVAKPEQ